MRHLPHRNGRSRLVVAGLLVVLTVGLGGGLWWWLGGGAVEAPPPQPLAKPPARPAGYVGSTACKECHAEVVAEYAGHPMSQSMARVTDPPIEDYSKEATTFKTLPNRVYSVEKTEDGVAHHEIGLDSAGRMIFDQRVPVHYAMGSGRRGRSYLLDRQGYLFLSPVSWYSQKKKWDLSPEYDPHNHPRFEREASDRCLTCHAGRMDYARKPTTELAQRYNRKSHFAELSIGCERCHGPAADHVAFHRDGNQADGAKDPIVNPERLPAARRDAVCNQCHLQGEHQILRYGRTHGDFRPGDLIGDIWTTFVRPPAAGGSSTKAVSQVEQMQASVCYQKSAGKLGCISCHDPHRIPTADEAVEFYRGKCLTCHSQSNQECSAPAADRKDRLDSCVACHMQPLSAEDVPHTTQTDHRIPKIPGAADRSGQPATTGVRIFDEADCPLGEVEKNRALGLMWAERAEQDANIDSVKRAAALLREPLRAAPDDLVVLDALALAAVMQGRGDEAVELWKAALKIDPKRQDALYSLAIHFHNSGQSQLAQAYLQRYVDVFPWRAETLGRLSFVMAETNQLEQALDAAQRSLSLDPSVPRTYSWMADLYEKMGRQEATDHYRDLWGRFEQQ